jgi:acetoin:2,6-dichlorophenolindophenol oxidoreductase subunit beta
MTTAVPTREIMYVEALREVLAEALELDPRVFLMGEEIGQYGGVFRATDGLMERFGPDRVRDTPIAEASFLGAAVGAAIVGRRPIVEIMFMDFIASAMDPIVNHAAKLRAMSGGQIRVPLIIRTQGGTGTRHGAQHSQMLESWFTHVPGLLVAMPSTPEDVKGIYRTALTLDDPVLIIEHRQLYRKKGPVSDERGSIPFGQGTVRRPGRDLTIVATSLMNHRALEAAETLAAEGIEAEVIDPRTLVPLDLGTIVDSVCRTNRLLVVHEEVERSGWGGELVALVTKVAFDYLDVPIPFGLELEAEVVPQVSHIVAAARHIVRG